MASALFKATAVGIALLVLFSLIGGVAAYEQVDEGHVGVTKNLGAVTGQTLEPGPHIKNPVTENVQNVEVRPRTYTMSQSQGEGTRARADAISVKTVNGTTVKVDVTVRYRINKSEADQFVTDWNNERQMERRLIRPTIRSDLRDEASDIQTSDIYTREGREALTDTAKASLEEEFSDEPLVLEEVQVRNINLPNSIDKRLDEKEEAKQQVEIEEEKVKQERARAEQKRVQAQADADVIRTKGEALSNNPEVLKLRLIGAYDEGTVFVTSGDEEILVNAQANSTNSTQGDN